MTVISLAFSKEIGRASSEACLTPFLPRWFLSLIYCIWKREWVRMCISSSFSLIYPLFSSLLISTYPSAIVLFEKYTTKMTFECAVHWRSDDSYELLPMWFPCKIWHCVLSTAIFPFLSANLCIVSKLEPNSECFLSKSEACPLKI